MEHAYQVALQTEPEDVKSTADYMEHIHEAELKEVFKKFYNATNQDQEADLKE